MFDLICPDPPWAYDGGGRPQGGVDAHYSTMTLDELAAMRPQLEAWMAPDCAVPMWATAPKLQDAFALGAAWGLEYVTTLLVWLKTKPRLQEGQLLLSVPTSFDALFHCGMGFYSRSATEYVLLFRRGRPPLPDDRTIGQVIAEPIREHSRKPDEAYHRLERLWPDARRLEMFARTRRPGWEAWGNQVDKFAGEGAA